MPLPDSLSSLLQTLELTRKSHTLYLGILIGFSTCLVSTSFFLNRRRVSRGHIKKDRLKGTPKPKPNPRAGETEDDRPIEIRRDEVLEGVVELIGPIRAVTDCQRRLADGSFGREYPACEDWEFE